MEWAALSAVGVGEDVRDLGITVERGELPEPRGTREAPALLEQYAVTGQVRFVFREFPLVSLHPTAPAAHAVAVCAGEQSATLYWAVHDEIFARSSELSDEALRAAASKAGLDQGKLDACLASPRADEAIADDMAKAREIGVEGTPTFYINGRAFQGELTGAGLAAAIDAELG